MTVAELIARLQTLAPDLRVVLDVDCDCYPDNIREVGAAKLGEVFGPVLDDHDDAAEVVAVICA